MVRWFVVNGWDEGFGGEGSVGGAVVGGWREIFGFIVSCILSTSMFVFRFGSSSLNNDTPGQCTGYRAKYHSLHCFPPFYSSSYELLSFQFFNCAFLSLRKVLLPA